MFKSVTLAYDLLHLLKVLENKTKKYVVTFMIYNNLKHELHSNHQILTLSSKNNHLAHVNKIDSI